MNSILSYKAIDIYNIQDNNWYRGNPYILKIIQDNPTLCPFIVSQLEKKGTAMDISYKDTCRKVTFYTE